MSNDASLSNRPTGTVTKTATRRRRASSDQAPSPDSASVSARFARAWNPTAWRRQLLQYFESWTGSLIVHIVIIVALALLTLSVPTEAKKPEIVSTLATRPDELLSQRLDERTEAAESLTFAAGVNSPTHATPLTGSVEPELSREVSEALSSPEVSLADVGLYEMPAAKLSDALGMQSPGDPAAAVDGYGGALDRLSEQLLMMLSHGKVLVVWLFDQSESMKDDQQQVKDRLERVYKELRLSNNSDPDAMLTYVASFGQTAMEHTRRPTSDLDAIRSAIDEIPVDESGVENACQTIIEALQQHRKFVVQGDRQLAIVVVTDESGDDVKLLDQAIHDARSINTPIYVLGYEAAFGYPYAYINWKDEATGFTNRLRINRGPESAFVEAIQTNGLWRRYDWHPSGFGPYDLVRLCRETGGTYYILPHLEQTLIGGEEHIFQIEAMRPYLPDLNGRQRYLEERQSSELRSALFEIIMTLNPYEDDRLELREYLPRDPAALGRMASEQFAKGQQLVAVYQSVEERLSGLARARHQEPSPRWQANYDMLLAQSVAYRVRAIEYMAYLDGFLKSPKALKDPKTTHWHMVALPRTITGEMTDADVARAKELFQAVITNHPGTPYESRARWEINRGFGVEMVEHYHDPRWDQVKWPKL